MLNECLFQRQAGGGRKKRHGEPGEWFVMGSNLQLRLLDSMLQWQYLNSESFLHADSLALFMMMVGM